MSLFGLLPKREPRPFEHLTDAQLQTQLIMAKLTEIRLLQFCLEVERRCHLVECHGRVEGEPGELERMRSKFWKSYEMSVSGWDGKTPLASEADSVGQSTESGALTEATK